MLSSFSLLTATLSIQGNIFFFAELKFKEAVFGPENVACFFKSKQKTNCRFGQYTG